MSQDFDKIVQFLDSRDPEKRKKAIAALAKSGDRRALKPLAEVHKSDPDPEVRQLALKAGRHLQKVSSGTAETASEAKHEPNAQGLMFASSYGKAESDQASDLSAMPKEISEKDKQRAKAFLDRAVDEQVGGNTDKMMQSLGKAIDINPKLANDGQLLGLISMAIGVSGPDAIAALDDYRKSGKKLGGKAASGPNSFSDFMVEMTIWLIVVGLILSGVIFGAMSIIDWGEFRDELQIEIEADPTTEMTPTTMETLDGIEAFGDLPPVVALLGGFGGSAGFIAYTVLSAVFIWFVGTFIGGSGLVFTFIQYYTRAQMAVYVLIILATFGAIIALVASPPEPASFLMILGGYVIGVYAISLGVTSFAVGAAHEFGTLMGCVNLILAGIALGVLNCGLSYLTLLGL